MRCSGAIVLLTCAVAAFATDYTTYVGDSYPYRMAGIATDRNGNIYIAGNRVVSAPSPFDFDLPVSNSPALNYPVTDVLVGKLDSSGSLSQLVTLGAAGTVQANGIAVDSSGNIYVAGWTTAADFPLHRPLQSTPGTGQTAFLVKLAPDGAVIYSTFLGGTKGKSFLTGVAVDSKGDVYVTGSTNAADYPRTPGLPAGRVDAGYAGIGSISAAFFAKVASTGDSILYAGGLVGPRPACGTGSTCSTSSIESTGTSIAVDLAGNAYLAGNTWGTGLPATSGALRTEGIGAFVAKVNPSGSGLVYLTLLGAANYFPPPVARNSAPGNLVFAITADPEGNAYIAGSTSDPLFPATPFAFQPALSFKTPANPFLGPPSDAFVAKLNPTGSATVWATFLGGTAADQAQNIATDAAGNVWVSGLTSSPDFPGSSLWPKANEFLVELNSSGTALSYSAIFPTNFVAAVLALDTSGQVRAAGHNGLLSTFAPGSPPGRTSAPRLFGIGSAAGSVLTGRVAPGELMSIYGLHLGPITPVSASFDAAGFLPTTLAGVQVMIGGSLAPLLYVSDTQINAVVPVELALGSSWLQVIRDTAPLQLLDFRLAVDIAAPQVFHNADGAAAAINEDGTVNSRTNPARAGSYVSIWATGIGYFSGADGQMATGPDSLSCCDIYAVTFPNISKVLTSYTGVAPGMVNGVAQINYQIPRPAGGVVESVYSLGVAGRFSDRFSISVAP